MLIDIYSDIHKDTWERREDFSLRGLFKDNQAGDVAVFAGDAGNGWHHYEEIVSALKKVYGEDRVVHCPGNHDYYGNRSFSMREDPRSQSIKEIDGVTFGACTYWTDFRRDSLSAAYASRSIMDWIKIPEFRDISVGFDYWLLPLRLHEQDKAFLTLHTPDVVVTHFAPCLKSIHPKYDGDLCNPYFVNDHEDFIREIEPALWIHGHTHHELEYQVGNTFVEASPFGYPNENFHSIKELKPKTVSYAT
jgi:predicted phosphodiesterase